MSAAVADVLAEHWMVGYPTACRCGNDAWATTARLAHVTDALQSVIAAGKAEAWDEGHRAAQSFRAVEANPYREGRRGGDQ